MIKAILFSDTNYQDEAITKSLFRFDRSCEKNEEVLKYTHVLLVIVVLDPNGMELPFLTII